MEIRKNRKTREPREHKQPHICKWEEIGPNTFSVLVDNYTLNVHQVFVGEWQWSAFRGGHPKILLKVSGFKPSKQSAKNAAVFQMNKHKKSLIRKTVNS